MRICVVGAGAIGGFLACKLALAGHEVSVLARGAHLEAIRRQGLTLIDQHGGTQRVAGVRAADAGALAELGEQELVFLALKAHQIADVAPRLGALLGAATPVVALQNGLPWWYFHQHGGPFDGRRLESVDPGGRIAQHLPVERVIGSVAHKGAEVSAPGVVRHTVTAVDRFPLGEPDGRRSERIEAISAMLDIGHVRPSMLQDTQAGRPLEIDALLGVIVELARLTDTAVPSIQAVYACAKLLDTVIAEQRVRIVPQRLAA